MRRERARVGEDERSLLLKGVAKTKGLSKELDLD